MSLSLFRGIVDDKNPRMRAAVLPRILLASFATTACVPLAADPVPDASRAGTTVVGQEKSSHPGESMEIKALRTRWDQPSAVAVPEGT